MIISPNPNSGTFTISTKEKGYSITITNLLGEKVYASPSLKGEKKGSLNPKGGNTHTPIHGLGASGEQTIDLSFQPDGIYFLQLKTSEGIAVKKMAINK